ncbi:MAG TPA: hypothetical protein VHH34_00445, partial [Pseudonocardiaceae bacterium]|nr:hypothetical protein [Pseudonocardiaceae bacterium]
MWFDRRLGQDEDVVSGYPVVGLHPTLEGRGSAPHAARYEVTDSKISGTSSLRVGAGSRKTDPRRVDLYRSKPDGDVVHLQGKQLDTGEDTVEIEFRVSLAPFEDGGWVWFDVAPRRAPD